MLRASWRGGGRQENRLLEENFRQRTNGCFCATLNFRLLIGLHPVTDDGERSIGFNVLE